MKNTAKVTDRTATVTLDGKTYTHDVGTLAEARVKVFETIRHAPRTTYPLTLSVEDPDGTNVLTLFADGKVEVEEPEQHEAAPVVEEPEQHEAAPVVEDDDEPVPAVEVQETPTPRPTPAAPVVEVKKAPVPRRGPAAPEAQAPTTEDRTPAAPPRRSADSLPTAADFHASKPKPQEAPAATGWRGALNALGFRFAPTEAERAERADTRDVQRGVTSHKTVMVANLKGGAGKTTFTYLLAALLGRVRGGTVLAWDNNENRGTLAHRSPFDPNTRATAIDLLSAMTAKHSIESANDLVNYTRPQGGNKFDILASQNQGGTRPVIDGDGFTNLHRLLRSFYRMVVVDTGNASNASTWQATAAAADLFVIVCENAEDSAQTAADTLDLLRHAGYGSKVRNSVVVVMDARRADNAGQRAEDAARLGRIRAHFSDHVRAVQVLPWEESLQNGAWIDWDSLSPKMHRAMLATAADVVRGM